MKRILAILAAGVLFTTLTSLAAAADPLTLTMNAQNNSGQTGTAKLNPAGAKTDVILDIKAGAASVPQPAHVHDGTCATLGAVKYPLTNVVDGKSTTTIDVDLDTLLKGTFAVNVHKSGAEATVYVSCADIKVTAAPAAPAQVKSVKHATIGNMLVSGAGRSIYLYTRDERNKSNCTGNCLVTWPPVITEGDPVAGEGVTQSILGSITTPDGKKQTTYNGWPLYYYVQDTAANDAKGQNVGNVWFAVHGLGGGPIQNGAQVKLAKGTTLGDVLTDASGRTLYMYTRDEPGKSNCTGGCLRAWPALLSVGAAVATEGVNASLFGTFTRDDGTVQVTYNKYPLYYYAPDTKPGDMIGQNVGTVWFVLNAAGTPIGIPPAAPAPAPAPAPVALPRTGESLPSALPGAMAVLGVLLLAGGILARRHTSA